MYHVSMYLNFIGIYVYKLYTSNLLIVFILTDCKYFFKKNYECMIKYLRSYVIHKFFFNEFLVHKVDENDRLPTVSKPNVFNFDVFSENEYDQTVKY